MLSHIKKRMLCLFGFGFGGGGVGGGGGIGGPFPAPEVQLLFVGAESAVLRWHSFSFPCSLGLNVQALHPAVVLQATQHACSVWVYGRQISLIAIVREDGG
jgi:hypothetical protein